MDSVTLKRCKAISHKEYIPTVIITFSIVLLLSISWFKWGNFIIDTGRELYVPAQLAAGKVLYRDIFYLYGPLSPYLNAFLYKLFGVKILSLVLGGIAAVGCAAYLIYKISRVFLGIFHASFVVMVFLFVFAFGDYDRVGIFNFIIPYSYAATQATVFALASLYFVCAYWNKHRMHYGFLAGFFVFLCMACRIEIGCMLVAAVGIGAIVLKSGERRLSGSMSIVRPLILLPLLLSLCFYGLFFLFAGSKIVHSVIGDIFQYNINTRSVFTHTQLLMGLDNVRRNLLCIGIALVFYAVLAGWFLSAGALISHIGKIKNPRFHRILQGAVGIIGIGSVFFIRHWVDASFQYRCLPLILLFMACYSGVRFLRHGKDAYRIRDLILSLFGLFMLLRIFLHCSPFLYGFYLLVPGLVGYHVFFFKTLPGLMKNRAMHVVWNAGFTVVLVLFCFDYFALSYSNYSKRTLSIPSPTGNLFFNNTPWEQSAADLVKFLSTSTAANDGVAVFPEGLTINFLAQRDNPLYYYSYLPQDFIRPDVSEDIIKELDTYKVPYVVLVQRAVMEYGSKGFGVDYAQEVWNYITKRYWTLAYYGPQPFELNNFGYILFKRR